MLVFIACLQTLAETPGVERLSSMLLGLIPRNGSNHALSNGNRAELEVEIGGPEDVGAEHRLVVRAADDQQEAGGPAGLAHEPTHPSPIGRARQGIGSGACATSRRTGPTRAVRALVSAFSSAVPAMPQTNPRGEAELSGGGPLTSLTQITPAASSRSPNRSPPVSTRRPLRLCCGQSSSGSHSRRGRDPDLVAGMGVFADWSGKGGSSTSLSPPPSTCGCARKWPVAVAPSRPRRGRRRPGSATSRRDRRHPQTNRRRWRPSIRAPAGRSGVARPARIRRGSSRMATVARRELEPAADIRGGRPNASGARRPPCRDRRDAQSPWTPMGTASMPETQRRRSSRLMTAVDAVASMTTSTPATQSGPPSGSSRRLRLDTSIAISGQIRLRRRASASTFRVPISESSNGCRSNTPGVTVRLSRSISFLTPPRVRYSATCPPRAPQPQMDTVRPANQASGESWSRRMITSGRSSWTRHHSMGAMRAHSRRISRDLLAERLSLGLLRVPVQRGLQLPTRKSG